MPPQTTRKPKDSEIDFVNENLEIIRSSVLEARKYIQDHPFSEASEENRPRAFKFQADLIDKITDWNEKYMEGVGIMAIFERSNQARKKNRAGQVTSGIETLLNNNQL